MIKKPWHFGLFGALIMFVIFSPELTGQYGSLIIFIVINTLWWLLGKSFLDNLTFHWFGGTDATVGMMDRVTAFHAGLLIVGIYMLIGYGLGLVIWNWKKKRNTFKT